MGRPKRADEAGGIYHMLNRANRRETIFHKDVGYGAFENVLCLGSDPVYGFPDPRKFRKPYCR